MTFQNLHQDTVCNCIGNDCFEDSYSYWGIKTNKNIIRENDFKTHSDKGAEKPGMTCDEICSLKGKSMSIIKNDTNDNKEAVLAIFKELFPIAPGYKPYLSIIKFKQVLGLFKSTPLIRNQFHHDFYKCDAFMHTEAELIETISLSADV